LCTERVLNKKKNRERDKENEQREKENGKQIKVSPNLMALSKIATERLKTSFFKAR
jgi:hypothetical protein